MNKKFESFIISGSWFVISRIFVGFVFLSLVTLVIYFFVLFPFVFLYLILFVIAFIIGTALLTKD